MMEELTTQFGPAAAMLVGLVAGIVQQFKRSTMIERWQEKLPIYQALSLGLGIFGAFQFAIPNPVFAGLFIGLASMGAYDAAKRAKISEKISKVIPILLILFLIVSCTEQSLQPRAWLLSGSPAQDVDLSDVEYVGRLGLGVEETEFGLSGNWWQESPRYSFGVYALQYFEGDLNGLLGIPYLGVQPTIYVKEGKGGMLGFIVGSVREIGGVNVVAEFNVRTYGETLEQQMDQSEDKYRGFVGLQIPFPID